MNYKLKQLRGALFIGLFALALFACKPKIEEGQLPASEIPAAGSLQIFALDVGQGDSLLIISPQGKSVLIDAGPVEAGDDVVNALRNHGVTQLDLVVATHPHADHIGGMKRLLDNVPVKKFLDSGQNYSTVTYEKMLQEIKDKKIDFIKAVRGQNIELDSGVKFEVLNPGKELFKAGTVTGGRSVENANSVVLRLSYGTFAMLFTGDAEFETEVQMMAAGLNLSADILKIGHHGSRHATSGKFLTAVNPKVAIISAGATNDYGHPAQLTLDHLKQSNIKTFRTDLNGEIAITSDGKQYEVKPARQANPNELWIGRQPAVNP